MNPKSPILARASILAALAAGTLATIAPATARAEPSPSQAQAATPTVPVSTPPPSPERGSKEAATSTAGLTSVPAPTPAEIRYRRVAVDIVSTRPDAVVERRVSIKEESGAFLVLPWRDTQATWEQICVAPCLGADLDRYSTYRVSAANGISSSHAFTLPQVGDTVHLRLDAGDRRMNRLGVALGAAGFAALVVGGSLVLDASSITTHEHAVRTRDAGFITGGAGLVLLAIGIPLAIMTRTYVYADDNPVRAASTKPRFVGNGFVF